MTFTADCLKAHNDLRKKHASPPLKLNKRLSQSSKEYAEQMARTGLFRHSTRPDVGENLFYYQTNDPSYKANGQQPVKSWYSEIQYYNFNGKEPDLTNFQCGHFTQLLWKQTRKMGAAFARCGDTWYIVCTYAPAGNIRGQFCKNVLPPRHHC